MITVAATIFYNLPWVGLPAARFVRRAGMLDRVLENEVMDSDAEALAYDRMDHAAVNRAFVEDLLAAAEGAIDLARAEVLDLGTGTALIPIVLCRQCNVRRIVAVDAAGSMLALARKNVRAAGCADRVVLARADAKRLPCVAGRFTAVISNSIAHHIPQPATILAEALRAAAPGGLLFFRDLARPADEATLSALVATYAGGADCRQRGLFAASLRAALTVSEVRQLVRQLGFGDHSVRMTSDRHWTWSAIKG
jgi:ubiquinone/menaquinone biosynthesis C-methylase UbiE